MLGSILVAIILPDSAGYSQAITLRQALEEPSQVIGNSLRQGREHLSRPAFQVY